MSKSVEVVKLLLQYHADPCAQDADGKTPLHKVITRMRIFTLALAFLVPSIANPLPFVDKFSSFFFFSI